MLEPITPMLRNTPTYKADATMLTGSQTRGDSRYRPSENGKNIWKLR